MKEEQLLLQGPFMAVGGEREKEEGEKESPEIQTVKGITSL